MQTAVVRDLVIIMLLYFRYISVLQIPYILMSGIISFPFSALTLLVGRQEEHLAC